MADHNNLSRLESLPQDLLSDILSRVAASSREDIRECITVSQTIALAAQDDRVYNMVNLQPQTMNPLTMIQHYHNLMDRCIASDNPAAHYIHGIKEYFIHDNTNIGLYHLKKAAEGSYDNGTYLYGILMLCTGNLEEGKKSLNLLGWEASKRRADRCWKANKRSLRHIIIIMKNEYTASLMNNEPPQNCHMNDLGTRCPKCYHYKQMHKFIE